MTYNEGNQVSNFNQVRGHKCISLSEVPTHATSRRIFERVQPFFAPPTDGLRLWHHRMTPEGLVALIEQPRRRDAGILVGQVRVVFIAKGAKYDPMNEAGWTLAYARLMGDPNFVELDFVETIASEEQQGYRQFLCSVSESLGQQRGVVPLGVISVPGGLVYLTSADQMALEIRHLQLESIGTRDTVLQREMAQKSEDPAAFLDRVWVGMHRHAATLQAASPNAGMHWPPCVRSSLAMEHSGMNLMLTTLELMLSIDPALAAALLRSSTSERPFRYRLLFPHTFFELACDFPVDSAVFDAIFNKELQRGIDDGVGEEYFLRALRLQHLQAMHAVLQHHQALGLSHDWIERTIQSADASQPFPEGIALVGSYFAKAKADAVLAELQGTLARPDSHTP